ncbi:MAG: hypothetical protein ACRBK7_20765 [Acidimicrobiales bacterium]
MRATYVAWNGQSYPWPPPEGWHEGSDGRWWAAGSGPDEFQETSNEAESDEAAAPAEQDTVLSGQSRSPDILPPTESPQGRDLGPLPGAADGIWQPDHPEDREWWKRPPVVLTAAIALLLLIVIAVVSLQGSDAEDASERTEVNGSNDTIDDQSQPATNRSTDDVQNSTTITSIAGISPSTTDASTTVPGDDASSTTADQPTTSTSTDLATEASTETVATAVIPPVTIDPADQARVDELRAFLDQNGLSGDLISDADLVEFGNTFCIFAIAADNAEQYTESRDEAIVDSSSELTQAELAVAVDGAVRAFCPADADRIGL